jgi:hypothetical protein
MSPHTGQHTSDESTARYVPLRPRTDHHGCRSATFTGERTSMTRPSNRRHTSSTTRATPPPDASDEVSPTARVSPYLQQQTDAPDSPDLGRVMTPLIGNGGSCSAARTSILEAATTQEHPYTLEHDLHPKSTRTQPWHSFTGPKCETLLPSSSPGAQVVPTIGSDGGEVKGAWGRWGWLRRLGCHPSRLTLGDVGAL